MNAPRIAGIGGLLVGVLACSGGGARPPQADCGAVAESLVSLEIGNYAAAADRVALLPAKRALCARHRVSVAEAACLAKAADVWSAGSCVPRMFPQAEAGGCEPVMAKIRTAVVAATRNDPSSAPMIEKALAIVRQSCAEDGWPEPLVRCILAAPGVEIMALSSCDEHIPPGLKQKLQERMRTMTQ